jgi:hypothetical protein
MLDGRPSDMGFTVTWRTSWDSVHSASTWHSWDDEDFGAKSQLLISVVSCGSTIRRDVDVVQGEVNNINREDIRTLWESLIIEED